MMQRIRKCTGGRGGWCGKLATVVCCELDDGSHGTLQWYACDALEHQEGAATEPIGDWFDRINASLAAAGGGE